MSRELPFPAADGRARLEHRLALDLACAGLAHAGRRGGSTLIVASSPVWLREALFRLTGEITVLGEDEATLRLARLVVDQGELRRDTALDIRGLGEATVGSLPPAGSVLWAAPRRATWRRIAQLTDAALVAGGALALVADAPLARLLDLRHAARGLAPAWHANALADSLQRQGYRRIAEYPLGGPASFFWAALAQAAGRAGRPALADRYEAAYRAALAAPVSRRWATCRVRVDRKGEA